MYMLNKIYKENYNFVYNYILKQYGDFMNDTFIDFIKFYDDSKSKPSTFLIMLMINKINIIKI